MTTILDVSGPLDCEILSDGRSALIIKDYTVIALSKKITVPAGFRTDFASTPRILWSIWPPIGSYTDAAVVHDYLYTVTWFTRDFADEAFYNLMKVSGTPKFSAWIIYKTVRMFGKSYYNRKNK